jgi:hypothetical protein
MPAADRRLIDQLPFDQFHPVGLVQKAAAGNAFEIGDRRAVAGEPEVSG